MGRVACKYYELLEPGHEHQLRDLANTTYRSYPCVLQTPHVSTLGMCPLMRQPRTLDLRTV